MRSIVALSALLASAPAIAQDGVPFSCPEGSTMVELATSAAAPDGTRVVKRAPAGQARACLVDTAGGPIGTDALTLMGVAVVSAGVVTAVVTSSDDDEPVSR